ncbi:DUF4199 family protein [Candidatus Woesearchaeota archaeon]|nr:DUF4199 family protein [Candidatus Woesearchaeota archaeon]
MSSILDPLFRPLLNLISPEPGMGPFFLILLFSFAISLLITLVYKAVTDQDLMRSLKAEMKELQKEMKELRKDPQKMMEVQKKSMETNMKYMTHSFKPTLITLIPIIIIFGWMSSNLAVYPILENDTFPVTMTVESELIGYNVSIEVPEGIELVSSETQKIESEEVKWLMKGNYGNYNLLFKIGENYYEKDITISNQFGDYADLESKIEDGNVKSIKIGNEKVKPFQSVGFKFPWIGNFGWLGTYILFSIIFSIVIRKALKVA